MAEYIYSKIQPTRLLHIINRKEDIIEKRQDLIPTNESLQLATFELKEGKSFKPHKHLTRKLNIDFTPQEAWVCMSGKVKAVLYDLDDKILEEIILFPGDCSLTLFGGHTYKCLEDNTKILEFKVGPYLGQKEDKVFLDK